MNVGLMPLVVSVTVGLAFAAVAGGIGLWRWDKGLSLTERQNRLMVKRKIQEGRVPLTDRIELVLDRYGATGGLGLALLVGLPLAAGFGWVFWKVLGIPVVFAALAGPLPAGWLATSFLRSRARRQTNMFERQLQVFVTMLGSQMEAGYTLRAGIESALVVAEEPLHSELRGALAKMASRISASDAFRDIEDRYPESNISLLVTALGLDERTAVGAKLAPVLKAVAQALETKFALREEALAEVTQTRMQLYMVTGLAVGIVVWLYKSELGANLQNPTGHAALIIGGMNMGLGIMLAKRMMNRISKVGSAPQKSESLETWEERGGAL